MVKALAVAQNAFLNMSTLGLSSLTGLNGNIEIESSSGSRQSRQTEVVSWLSGDNVSLVANDTVYARGAELTVEQDMLVMSGGNVVWDAAIDQQSSHSYDNSEGGIGTSTEAFTRTSETTVNGVNATAGGNLSVIAGGNIQMVAAALEAGEDATLQADGSIALLSADEHYQSISQVRGKGDLGTANSLTKEELNRSVAVVSSIVANNIQISSGGDQYHAATALTADNDISLDAGGAIHFASVKDTEQYSLHSEGSDLLWMKVEGEGRYDETLRQAQIQAAGQLAINAAQGISIEIKEIDQATVSDTIAAMVETDPQLAWLKQMDEQGEVDWQRIKEVHDAWDYESQGMGAGLALAVTIAATVLTGGAGATVAASNAAAASVGAATSAVAGAAAGGTAAMIAGGAVSAGITTAASTLAVGTINNGGRFDQALSDFTSSDSLKSVATSMLTAGITQGLIDPTFDKWSFGKASTVQTDTVNSITKGFELNSLDGMLGFTAHHATQGLASAGIGAAIQGDSFSDLLKTNMESQGNNVLSGLAFNQVGNLGNHFAEGQLEAGSAQGFALFDGGGIGRVALHGVTGGLISDATGGDFKTGAAAAGLNQWLTPQLDNLVGENDQWRTAASQFTGIVGATIVGGDVNDGAFIAKQADTYNRALHAEELAKLREVAEELAREHDKDPERMLQLVTIAAYGANDEAFNEKVTDTLAPVMLANDRETSGLEAAFSFEDELLFEDLQLAQAGINAVAGTPILDDNGNPIIITGSELRLFQSTAEQYAASGIYETGGLFPGFDTGSGSLTDLAVTGDIFRLGAANGSLQRGALSFLDDFSGQMLVPNGSVGSVAPEVELALWFGGEKAGEVLARGVYNAGRAGIGFFSQAADSVPSFYTGVSQWLRNGDNLLPGSAMPGGGVGPNNIDSVAARRAYLNEKYGRTGDLNTDINIRGNRELATNFYLDQGWHPKRVENHVAGIDFSQPVDMFTLSKGRPVAQYQVGGNGVGNYFAPVGTRAEQLGVNPAGRETLIYAPTERVQVLSLNISPK